jgi:hypothetical protein
MLAQRDHAHCRRAGYANDPDLALGPVLGLLQQGRANQEVLHAHLGHLGQELLQRPASGLDELREELRRRPVVVPHRIKLEVRPITDVAFLGEEKTRRLSVEHDAIAIRPGIVAPLAPDAVLASKSPSPTCVENDVTKDSRPVGAFLSKVAP